MAKSLLTLGLIGPMASGKSEFAKIMVAKTKGSAFHTKIFSSTAYFDELAKSRNLEPNRENKQQLAIELEQENPTAITEILNQQIHADSSLAIFAIIDSIRSEAQAEKWLELRPKIQFLYFQTDFDIRFRRYNRREKIKGHEQISIVEFTRFHEVSTDHNLERLKKYVGPHNLIHNNGDIWSLEDKALEILMDSIEDKEKITSWT